MTADLVITEDMLTQMAKTFERLEESIKICLHNCRLRLTLALQQR